MQFASPPPAPPAPPPLSAQASPHPSARERMKKEKERVGGKLFPGCYKYWREQLVGSARRGSARHTESRCFSPPGIPSPSSLLLNKHNSCAKMPKCPSCNKEVYFGESSQSSLCRLQRWREGVAPHRPVQEGATGWRVCRGVSLLLLLHNECEQAGGRQPGTLQKKKLAFFHHLLIMMVRGRGSNCFIFCCCKLGFRLY